ncbi:uncharacterized protein B0P05DRAFT_106230 [Gilbertella persicaria]|uniref:uncharacterized protein n=1 Tax=Gilbertella persicaria TaxID=101096 RepID=UPI00221E7CDB|nr:uncharacterized protein B0P05DRAFT_106230 [Gilbertella persicaria]KAI8079008.1 hypothetical protein B0P05DRAFT_106230 [Gilbertella persicaria]
MLLSKDFLIIALCCLLLFSTTLADDSLIKIKSPSLDQTLVPGKPINIEYIINAQKKNAPPPNYPSSMDVYFHWKGDSKELEFKAVSGLVTQAIANGAESKTYRRTMKLPNCHFFKRYLPSEWSFTLVFQPNYPESIDPIGPKQANIVIPVRINTTATDDPHHNNRGC